MKKLLITQLLVGAMLLLIAIFLSSCADTQPQIAHLMTGHTYGFFGGLWHGMIMPISWIGSLFSDDIAVWAVNNTGGWYITGFVLGSGSVSWIGIKLFGN